MAFAFEKLLVYQKAVAYADAVCTLSKGFPRGYFFLGDQVNRAALSIPANIAEGNGTLHVAIARRMGWPVSLACADSHYVCRYDDGQHVYNIEASDTGRGGFAAGSDQEYIQTEGVSRKAIAVGSDLRKLTAREMLGVFVQARGRHFADTGKIDLAARDYALAHTLFPNGRKVYIGLVGNLVPVGERLFTRAQLGHPVSLAAYLTSRYQPRVVRTGRPAWRPVYRADPFLQVQRINEINRRNTQRMMQPPPPAEPRQPQRPGVPQAPQPHQPR